MSGLDTRTIEGTNVGSQPICKASNGRLIAAYTSPVSIFRFEMRGIKPGTGGDADVITTQQNAGLHSSQDPLEVGVSSSEIDLTRSCESLSVGGITCEVIYTSNM